MSCIGLVLVLLNVDYGFLVLLQGDEGFCYSGIVNLILDLRGGTRVRWGGIGA